ncbi:DUF1501 domain-containing protein [Verrucomicrobiaceae bacterium N1E253]|uniref:DUF1501 domain-containing protein n=1 Tax=Oceaniferula marina TaxID=2748318 RepID=A0A851GQR8_9BACT|nr:DUF1501 domain-containing protein [Oceaniferula marina]NWK57160.1 DUF1501 domain-containing protein [Oceaniferula marina]
MNDLFDLNGIVNRRQFFRKNMTGLGAAALASLLPKELMALGGHAGAGDVQLPHFAPKAKRVIYMSMIGAPSQLETFDYKPGLEKRFKEDLSGFLKESGVRLTTMTSGQKGFPVAPSRFAFNQHGESGAWVSELLPHTAKMVDDLCIIKSMHTDAINHEPANYLMYTGSMIRGKASMGSWLSYGLGSMNQDLPTFVVLHAYHTNPKSNVQAISSGLWGSGFLPGEHAGVSLRGKGDPVLYLKNAPGISREMRRSMLDGLNTLNRKSYEQVGDPEIQTRIQQYEMAFRMQASVPELTDMSGESEHTYELYGSEAKKRGSFAYSCLMARRLVERGTRFVQIFHRGWDQHGALQRDLPEQCKDVDQGAYALIQDLKQRGMLEDTLVVWGGEFGRTVYCQGPLSEKNYGRDHHPKCFTIWMAGGGIKPGMVYGETDEMSFNITTPDQAVHVRDLHATILHQLGIDHERLTYPYQGLDNRLTGVMPAKVVRDILT